MILKSLNKIAAHMQCDKNGLKRRNFVNILDNERDYELE